LSFVVLLPALILVKQTNAGLRRKPDPDTAVSSAD
jgi:hypothetical protein